MSTTAVAVITEPAAPVMPQQADSDKHLIRLLMNSLRSKHSKRAYKFSLAQFFAFTQNKSLREVRLDDLQNYAAALAGTALAASSQARHLGIVKSLFTFGQKLGYVPWNPGAALKTPQFAEALTERILSRASTVQLIAAAHSKRDHAILLLLYKSAIRRSELTGLRWKHMKAHEDGDGATLTVYGKGGKTRFVRIPADAARAVAQLRGPDASADDPIFCSRQGGPNAPMSASALYLLVKNAAARAGVPAASPHWMRHSHASHSLQNGADVALVAATLGHASIATTSKYLHADPKESSGKFLPDLSDTAPANGNGHKKQQ